MGLIHCPKCGETISDKAVFCPYCNTSDLEQKLIKCEDCGTEYGTGLFACPKCGCPKFIDSEQSAKKKYKGIIACVVLAALIVVGILGFSMIQKEKEAENQAKIEAENQAKAEAEYYANMETVSYAMLNGAVDAESAGNLIISVWHNVIWEERDTETDKYTMENGIFLDDFNGALSNLFSDNDFIERISEIETNQSEVLALMKKLRNPPENYEEAYAVLKVYYDNYLKMTKAVINPSGSLQTFSDDFNTYDTETANLFDKMKLYLD